LEGPTRPHNNSNSLFGERSTLLLSIFFLLTAYSRLGRRQLTVLPPSAWREERVASGFSHRSSIDRDLKSRNPAGTRHNDDRFEASHLVVQYIYYLASHVSQVQVQEQETAIRVSGQVIIDGRSRTGSRRSQKSRHEPCCESSGGIAVHAERDGCRH
jgi:hypothetical protein